MASPPGMLSKQVASSGVRLRSSVGGVGRSVRETKQFLPRAGWTVLVVCACSSPVVLWTIGSPPSADFRVFGAVFLGVVGLAGYAWRCALREREGAVRGVGAAGIESFEVASASPRRGCAEDSKHIESSFRLLADSLPQMVWSARRDGTPDYFNPHWCQFAGMTMEEAQAEGWPKMLHEDDAQRFFSSWVFAFAAGCSYTSEFRFKHAAEKRYYWHEITVKPLRDEGGAIVCWIGTGRELAAEFHEVRERVSDGCQAAAGTAPTRSEREG